MNGSIVFINCRDGENLQRIKYLFAFCVVICHVLPFILSGIIDIFRKDDRQFISVGFMPSVASVSIKSSAKQQVEKKNIKNNKIDNSSQVTQRKALKQTLQNQDNESDGDVSSSASAAVEYNIGSNENPAPKYPVFARQNGFQGRVNICVDIDSDGGVVRAIICKSSGYGILDTAALNTVKKWKFKINTVFNGYKSVIVPINFVLS